MKSLPKVSHAPPKVSHNRSSRSGVELDSTQLNINILIDINVEHKGTRN